VIDRSLKIAIAVVEAFGIQLEVPDPQVARKAFDPRREIDSCACLANHQVRSG
jgi:hypothetical protein